MARFPIAIVGVALLATARSEAQTIWHVDDSASPGGDGLTWATAMNSLQSALDVVTIADQIWVAAGTYHPTNLSNPLQPRSARFWLHEPFKLYGGFDGTETSLSERDPALFDDTILSGDIGVPGNSSDNCFRVVEVSTGFPGTGMALLDGFRITGGNAVGDGGGVIVKGPYGELETNPKLNLQNCTLNLNSANRGGAIAVVAFGLVRLERCVVEGNYAASQGGAIYSFTGAVYAANTRFSENKCANLGGVLYTDSTIDNFAGNLLKHANCVFTGNEARLGGVAYIKGGNQTAGDSCWYNCTFVGNAASQVGGVLYAVTTTPVPAEADVFNSILWGNSAPSSPAIFGTNLDVRFSDVQVWYPGLGNMSVDPQFVGGERPGAGSPVNDAGSNGLIVNDYLDLDGDSDTNEPLPVDLLESPRRIDDPVAADAGAGTAPIVDMGAYEMDPAHQP